MIYYFGVSFFLYKFATLIVYISMVVPFHLVTTITVGVERREQINNLHI